MQHAEPAAWEALGPQPLLCSREVPPNLLLAVRLFWLPKMLERTVELQQLLRYGEWHGGHYVVKAEE